MIKPTWFWPSCFKLFADWLLGTWLPTPAGWEFSHGAPALSVMKLMRACPALVTGSNQGPVTSTSHHAALFWQNHNRKKIHWHWYLEMMDPVHQYFSPHEWSWWVVLYFEVTVRVGVSEVFRGEVRLQWLSCFKWPEVTWPGSLLCICAIQTRERCNPIVFHVETRQKIHKIIL